jgi:hypothetical protein
MVHFLRLFGADGSSGEAGCWRPLAGWNLKPLLSAVSKCSFVTDGDRSLVAIMTAWTTRLLM